VWVLAVFELLRLVGLWPSGSAVPPPPEGGAGTDWGVAAVLVLLLLSAVGWVVARDRLLPRRVIAPEEELAGHAAALVVLGVVGLLIVALNAYSLVFFLPAAHAWLWLVQLRGRLLSSLATFVAGLAGPALLLGSFAFRLDLGFDTPWYLSVLAANGYVPFAPLAIAVVFTAAAGQLGALSAQRYAPYPGSRERPPLGPMRRVLRSLVVASRTRQRKRLRVVERERAAAGG
jgi:hypothetical protein